MKKLAIILGFALASVGLFACGGDDGSTTASTAKLPLRDEVPRDSFVRYVADPNGSLAFHITEASGSAGKATIQFVNPQNVAHNVAIRDPSGKTIGETKRVSEGIASTKVVLKPGVYVIYCAVPGHLKAGMKGHLTVYPSDSTAPSGDEFGS